MKIGVLTSGSLGAYILDKILFNLDVKFVLTDSNSEEILKTCKKNKILYFKGNPRNGAGYNFIKNIEVDVIISVNYLFLIENDIIKHSKQLTFNIHGSLLPKYRGRTPHVWAIINNEKETGITAHVIDEYCDTGDIISQIKIQIDPFDTGNDLLNKFKMLYFSLITEVIEKIKSENIILTKQDENSSTYFGIRKPEDGRINWNWQKERIINWVRAQANPYPGAFSIVNNQKLIIDKVEVCSSGFRFDIENGTILSVAPNIIVKTTNGALEIKKSRQKLKLKIGDIFI